MTGVSARQRKPLLIGLGLWGLIGMGSCRQPVQDAPEAAAPEAVTADPVAIAPSPAPTNPQVAPEPSVLCEQVELSEPNQPIILSNLQFHRPAPIPFEFEATDAAEHLIGCVTNQTEAAITGVEIAITFELERGDSGVAVAQVDFPGEQIGPGQTVPFKHRSELDSDLIELTVEKVTTLQPRPGFEEYAYVPVDVVEPQIEIVHRPAQAPPLTETDHLCQDIEPPQSNAAIAVTNWQIYEVPQDLYDFREESDALLVGCVTNLSDRPLDGLSMAYSTETQSNAFATVLLPESALQPNQTLPFKKLGEVLPETQIIVVHRLGGVPMDVSIGRSPAADSEPDPTSTEPAAASAEPTAN